MVGGVLKGRELFERLGACCKVGGGCQMVGGVLNGRGCVESWGTGVCRKVGGVLKGRVCVKR